MNDLSTPGECDHNGQVVGNIHLLAHQRVAELSSEKQRRLMLMSLRVSLENSGEKWD